MGAGGSVLSSRSPDGFGPVVWDSGIKNANRAWEARRSRLVDPETAATHNLESFVFPDLLGTSQTLPDLGSSQTFLELGASQTLPAFVDSPDQDEQPRSRSPRR